MTRITDFAHEDHCGDVDCPMCADLTGPGVRGPSVDHGGRQPRRADPAPLSPGELARLRAMVGCRGCGAVRVDVTWRNGRSGTTVRHARGCAVRAAELAERRRDNQARGRASAASRRRNLDGPDPARPGPPPRTQEAASSPQGNAPVTIPDDPGGLPDAEGVIAS